MRTIAAIDAGAFALLLEIASESGVDLPGIWTGKQQTLNIGSSDSKK